MATAWLILVVVICSADDAVEAGAGWTPSEAPPAIVEIFCFDLFEPLDCWVGACEADWEGASDWAGEFDWQDDIDWGDTTDDNVDDGLGEMTDTGGEVGGSRNKGDGRNGANDDAHTDGCVVAAVVVVWDEWDKDLCWAEEPLLCENTLDVTTDGGRMVCVAGR